MENSKTFCLGLAAAFILAGEPALAQVYAWRDPATGRSKLSNIAPPWYNRSDSVRGPRVVATAGAKLIDDTALAYEHRLILLGRSNGRSERPHPQAQQESAGAREREQEPGAGGHAAD